jgi:hypothetical protein
MAYRPPVFRLFLGGAALGKLPGNRLTHCQQNEVVLLISVPFL